MNIIDIVIYGFIILFLLVCIFGEKKDVYCIDSNREDYGIGKGNAYYPYRPLDSDRREQLREKLIKTARYEFNSTSWRRCMIVAIISSFLGLILIFKCIPDGQSLGIMILLIFTVAYFVHLDYQRTIGVHAIDQLCDITDRLIPDD